jgi:hypothetical protein
LFKFFLLRAAAKRRAVAPLEAARRVHFGIVNQWHRSRTLGIIREPFVEGSPNSWSTVDFLSMTRIPPINRHVFIGGFLYLLWSLAEDPHYSQLPWRRPDGARHFGGSATVGSRKWARSVDLEAAFWTPMVL